MGAAGAVGVAPIVGAAAGVAGWVVLMVVVVTGAAADVVVAGVPAFPAPAPPACAAAGVVVVEMVIVGPLPPGKLAEVDVLAGVVAPPGDDALGTVAGGEDGPLPELALAVVPLPEVPPPVVLPPLLPAVPLPPAAGAVTVGAPESAAAPPSA